jgi:hypothetical protein
MRMFRLLSAGLLATAALAVAPRFADAAPDARRWSSVDALLAEVAPDARLARPGGPGNDGVFGEALGSAVAVSGNTLLVGAPEDRIARLGILGSVYVFVREPAGWRLDTKLLAPDGAAGDRFGASLALSGDTALIGAPGDDVGTAADRGSAHVFVRTASGWAPQARLDALDAGMGAAFGSSIALSGDTALVGAPGAAVGGVASFGSAWVFQRSGATWAQQARLTATDAAANQLFGTAVALSGTRVVVGAPGRVAVGGAYVFERNGSAWLQQATLVPGAADGGRAGTRVAIEGETIVLGEPRWGQAFIFERSGAFWLEQPSLDPPAGSSGAAYGDAVAISGDLVAVGQPFARVEGSYGRGTVDVWRRVAGAWTRVHRIAPAVGLPGAFGKAVALEGGRLVIGATDGGSGPTISGAVSVFEGAEATLGAPLVLGAGIGPNGGMGEAVAIDGDTLVLGAPFDPSAYVYVRSNGTWSLQQRLVVPAPVGRSVAVDGDTLVVGSPNDYIPNGAGFNQAQGSAWVFVRADGQWNLQQRLLLPDGAELEFFGAAVAVDGDTIAIGIPNARVGGEESQGAVQVYSRSGSTWAAQARVVADEFAYFQQFGGALALDGDRMAIGSRAGLAWIFERSGITWSRTAILTTSYPADRFGRAIALSGDRVLVGASARSIGGIVERGAADIFERIDGQWRLRGQLLASDGQAYDYFGVSVALNGDTALIGNFPANGGPPRSSEAAYVFERRGSGWRQDARWRPEDLVIYDGFGIAVALSGRTAIIGAPYTAGAAPWGNPGEGAGYVYSHVPYALFFDDFEP